ncbi:YidC/Oxa1 family membrane protein insertase [Patescibacteria group bacterium]|nr:YidC/Oxa1 family membrane protein insertase [Patescibacteria group bacterium]
MLTTIWNTIFTYPLLNITLAFYHLCGDNLGIAILLIAILTRLILIPLMKRQTEMTRKMAGLKPQLDELKKKYGSNPQKLSEEQTKLYKKVGYNPLGCLVTMIPQLIVLSALIVVIRNLTENKLEGVYPFIQTWFTSAADFTINTKFLFWDLTKSYSTVGAEFGKFSMEAISYLILALLVGGSQYVTTIFTMKMQNPTSVVPEKKKEKKKGEPMSPEALQGNMTKSMNLILPLSTIFIAVSASSALSIYWVAQSLMLVAQYWILDWDKTKKGVQNLYTKYFKKSK